MWQAREIVKSHLTFNYKEGWSDIIVEDKLLFFQSTKSYFIFCFFPFASLIPRRMMDVIVRAIPVEN